MRNIYLSVLSLLSLSGMAQSPSLQHVNSFQTGIFDEGAAEIVSYQALNQRVYFSNAEANSIGVLDVSDPQKLSLITTIDLDIYGGGVNSVVAGTNFIAVAVEDSVKQNPGSLVFFDLNGTFLNQLTVGALPDMVALNSSETLILTANEGEPNDDYTNDPLGSVSIIDLTIGITNLVDTDVTTLDFSGFTSQDLDSSIRIFGNSGNASIAQDLEPEYIAFHPNGLEAKVVCQENNAVITIDLVNFQVQGIKGLGFKDHSLPGNGFDASDKDGTINILPRPTLGMFQPDAIRSMAVGGNVYYISANEGDSRDYSGYSEEVRVDDLILDPIAYPNAAFLQADTNLGRLKTTTATGDYDGDGDIDQIFSYGARSFSIWDENFNLVYDSGDQLESILSLEQGQYFNSTNDDNDSFDKRSDDKGPEPEAIAFGRFGNQDLVFVAAERHGGIFMFDVSNPTQPNFLDFVNNRNFLVDADDTLTGDLGPEDIVFIDGNTSPIPGSAMLIVANEVSGTVSFFEISQSLSLNEAETMIQLFPNPTQNHLTILYDGLVEIINTTGQTMVTYKNTGQALDVSGLPSGYYIVRTENGQTLPFVKQ